MGDGVESGALLAVRVDHVPWGFTGVGVGEHEIFGARVLHPARTRFNIHWAELPTARRVLHSLLKTLLLHDIADREPVLHQYDPRPYQDSFKFWTRLKKVLILEVAAKTHDVFDPCAVVPAAVKQDQFARRR